MFNRYALYWFTFKHANNFSELPTKVCIKESVRKKQRKAEPLTLTAKKYVYNKTT